MEIYFEVPYWLDTIKNKRYDQIYHEHVTYFTVKSAYNLLKKMTSKLKIFLLKTIMVNL